MNTEHKVVVAIAASREGQAQNSRRDWRVALPPGGRRVVSYAVHTLPDTPGSFMMVEVYSSEEAFQDHLSTEHVVAFIADLPTLVEVDLVVYQGAPEHYSSGLKGLL